MGFDWGFGFYDNGVLTGVLSYTLTSILKTGLKKLKPGDFERRVWHVLYSCSFMYCTVQCTCKMTIPCVLHSVGARNVKTHRVSDGSA